MSLIALQACASFRHMLHLLADQCSLGEGAVDHRLKPVEAEEFFSVVKLAELW